MEKKFLSWDEDEIEQYMNSAKNGMQLATDEALGKSAADMKSENILSDVNITGTTDSGELIVIYRGREFTLTIDHPEL